MTLPLRRRSAPLFLLLALVGLSLSAAPQGEARFVPALQRLQDDSSFSGRETRIDFEALLPGTPIGNQFVTSGVSFRLGGGLFPAVWRDTVGRTPRARRLARFGSGDHALNNFLAYDLSEEEVDSDASHSLEIRFGRPVTRIGFEIRAGREEILNAEVRCLRAGTLVGRGTLEADASYRFVGFESRHAFDEIRLAFVNPAHNTFSLDDLAFELALGDRDRDGIRDFADLCPSLSGAPQTDGDRDGVGDACDLFPFDPENDVDVDGIGAETDNSPYLWNPDQEDVDGNGVGDVGELGITLGGNDADGDGIADGLDNCPDAFNPEQADCDGDFVGDVCDSTLVQPGSIELQLSRGESFTLTKRICLPPVPRRVDVVIAFDLTGSMSGELAALKANIANFIQSVRAGTSSDVRFGLVSYKDYPAIYDSCGYVRRYGGAADHPFRVDAPIGSSDAQVVIALNGLTTGGGGDGPESYTRVLWETAQPDSGVGFRRGAARFVIVIGDDVPHDCNAGQGLAASCTGPISTGQDPGRDGVLSTPDDLDFQFDALADLVNTDTTLFTVFCGTAGFCAWNRWSRVTGGRAVQINNDGSVPPGVDLDALVLDVLTDPVVHTVQLVPIAPCGLEFTFDPPILHGPFDVSNGAAVFIEETIHVPLDFPGGEVLCGVVALADGTLVGTQKTRVVIPCESVDFAGFVNGHAVQPGDFATQGFTLHTSGPNRGAAVFDSTPSGPNAGSTDPDLLVNLGNLLILQENQGQTVPGIFDLPDDARAGGTFTFDFTAPSQLESVVLADIDGGQPATVTLTDGGGAIRRYAVPASWTTDIFSDGPPGYQTLDLVTLAPQPGFVGSATATQDAGFDASDVVRLVIQLTGSGGIDDLIFCATR